MSESRQYTIGEVGFRKRGIPYVAREDTLMGDARVAVLRAFFRGEDLGELEAFVWDPVPA